MKKQNIIYADADYSAQLHETLNGKKYRIGTVVVFQDGRRIVRVRGRFIER